MKILLYSEQIEDAEIMAKMIKANNSKLEVIKAQTTEQALTYASIDGPFLLFVLDFDSKTNPDELGRELIEMTGSKPLLFTGREAIINDLASSELFDSHPTNSKVAKPTSRKNFSEELKVAIDGAFKWVKQEDYEQSVKEVNIEDFLPMKLKSFFLYETFPYDLHLAITSKTLVRIISADKPYTHSTLSKYAKKNVKSLYIKKDDQIKYLERESKLLLKALKRVQPNDKGIFLLQLRAITVFHQYMIALGVTDTVLQLGSMIGDNVIENFKSRNSLKPILQKYPEYYQGIASKSLLTAYITLSFAWKLGWESNTTKLKLVMSALLQDITLPDEAMAKANSLRSPHLNGFEPRDLEAFKSHPVDACSFAKQFTAFPDIEYIIEYHHELPSRKGFPNRPSNSKLTQICAVFNVAQHLAAEIDGESLSNTMLQKITRPLEKIYNGGHFRDVVKIAINEVKVK